MPTVQRWGRNESLIWPPRTYLYTLSAFFLSLAATGLFVYVHFQFGFSPLERYYLPYYLRSEMPSLTHHASTYQLLYVSDGNSRARPALAADVRSGQTAQPTGAPLPLALSAQARQQGFRLLFREPPRNYPNQTFHAWLAQWIYDDVPLDRLFNTQLMLGLAAFVLQLPFSIRKDIQRRKATAVWKAAERADSCQSTPVHESRCRQWHRHCDQRFQAPVADSTRRRE